MLSIQSAIKVLSKCYNKTMSYSGKRNGFINISKSTGSLGEFGIDNPVEHYLGYYLVVQKLEKVFKQILDAELQDKVNIASYAAGNLGVFCDDATSATVMRYATNNYINKLKEYSLFKEIKSIKVRVKTKKN